MENGVNFIVTPLEPFRDNLSLDAPVFGSFRLEASNPLEEATVSFINTFQVECNSFPIRGCAVYGSLVYVECRITLRLDNLAV